MQPLKTKNLTLQYVEKIDIEAADTVPFHISVSNRYKPIDIIEGRISKHH